MVTLATKFSTKLHKPVPSQGLSEAMLFCNSWWRKMLFYAEVYQRGLWAFHCGLFLLYPKIDDLNWTDFGS